jgi:Cd2+/Zn2+-exporting ATPase
VSDSNNDDFLFLGEEEEAPSSLSIELKKSDNIKKEKVENNAILINKNDKVNFNDFVNSDILSKLTKISFILLIFTSLCFTISYYDVAYLQSGGEHYLEGVSIYFYFVAVIYVFLPSTIILYLISFIFNSTNKNNSNKINPSEIINSEEIDSSLSSSLGGVWNVGWEVFGIDCPDCATKISKSLNSLKGVSNAEVSITTALVNFEIDLEIQRISKVNSILCDLGYAPNAKWWSVIEISSKKTCTKLNIGEKKLLKILNIQPGVLESRIEEDKIFIRLPTKIGGELTKEFQKAIDEVLGQKTSLKPKGGEWGLRPDQKQLLDGLIGLVFLPIVYFIQFLVGRNGEIDSLEYHLQYLISLPVIIIGSNQLRKKSYESIKRFQLSFEILVSMAIFGAVLLQAWFEALLIIVLVALANNLENSAIRKARDSMQGGLNRIPNDARLVQKKSLEGSNIVKIKSLKLTSDSENDLNINQNSEIIPVGLLNIGDHIEIRTGEIIPVDGKIIGGEGLVDKSALTGESLPLKLSKGDFIEAGLILTRGPIIVETSATGSNTRLSELIDTTKQYQEAPTRLHTILELFTNIWVPLVLFGSVFVALILPESIIEDGSRFKIILLLWVTACPCALLICAPIPHSISISMASSKGVVAKGGDVLERIAKVNLALLDKTGTLTEGRPQITEIISTKGSRMKTIIGISAGLELSSNHPYASAIIDKSNEDNISPCNIQNLIDGDGGVSGTYNGENVAIGNVDWIKKQGYNIPKDLLTKLDKIEATGISILTKGKNAIAAFGFASDSLNPHSSKLISNLNKQQIKVELLSGDNQESVNKTANDLGIPVEICRGGLTPEQKVDWVKQRSVTHITLMAGDGFNDAAAMAKADIGISVGNKEQLNLDAADVMIPSERPDLISSLCELSKKTRIIVIQNLILSISLTLILVFSVISGKNDQIWLNVLAHEFSVLLVILNAMKLGAYQFDKTSTLSGEEEISKFNMFSVISNIFKELYDDSKEVILALNK